MSGRTLVLAASVTACIAAGTALSAQKFPWQTGPDAKQGEQQGKKAVVSFVGPEQVEVTARQPQVVDLQLPGWGRAFISTPTRRIHRTSSRRS